MGIVHRLWGHSILKYGVTHTLVYIYQCMRHTIFQNAMSPQPVCVTPYYFWKYLWNWHESHMTYVCTLDIVILKFSSYIYIYMRRIDIYIWIKWVIICLGNGLSTLGLYLKQRWLITNWIHVNKHQNNLKQNVKCSSEKINSNVICKMSAIFTKPHHVNHISCRIDDT